MIVILSSEVGGEGRGSMFCIVTNTRNRYSIGNIIHTQPENVYRKGQGTTELKQIYESAKLMTSYPIQRGGGGQGGQRVEGPD
jgi:hypothetical protein